ncbi:MAG: hypothetical protein ACRD12_11290 [Acidimicrobiales bacterium]
MEINAACEQARDRGLKRLAPARERDFADRYDALVADGLAANPEPGAGRKRNSLQRQSFNLATAFSTHRRHVLRFMYDLRVGFTNQAERGLRPTKLLVYRPSWLGLRLVA